VISPIVVIKVGDHWEARCHSLRCEMRHVVATGRTCGEAEAAAMPHLREVAGPARVERADVVTRLARARREQGLAGGAGRGASMSISPDEPTDRTPGGAWPLRDRIADALIAHDYPASDWPDGPPGEGEMDTARSQADAVLAVLAETCGSPLTPGDLREIAQRAQCADMHRLLAAYMEVDAHRCVQAERIRALEVRARQAEAEREGKPAVPALAITVLGQPAPQGSKHARPIYKGRGENRQFTGRVAQVESSKDKVKSWREAVKTAAFEARQARGFTDRFLPDGPVGVEVTYCFDKPASAPKTRRTWPVKRSTFDVDKLLRSTFDALTDAGTFKDDSQVIDVRARKVYTDDPAAPLAVPGAVIRIWTPS